MENLTIQQENIRYYSLRLEEIIRIYREEGRELLDQNLNKIKSLINKYKNFKDNQDYNPSLVGAVETFVLGI